MFENKNKVCVGGVVLAESLKVFQFLKIKTLLYYFKGLTGADLAITIVLLSQSMFENKNKVCVGVWC